MFEHNEHFKTRLALQQRSSVAPGWILPLLILILGTGICYFVSTRFGTPALAVMVVGLVLAGLMTYVSMRDLSFALICWFVTMGTVKAFGMITMPALPDFSIDRLMLVWIVFIFVFRSILAKERLRGPFTADVLALVQVIYIWVQMQFLTDSHTIHEWVLSSLSPLFAFFFGKYVVDNDRILRNVLIIFFVLSVYYYVTSIAEHFRLDALVWPKSVLNPQLGFWAAGRSRGPLLHPPLFGQVLASLGLIHFYFIARVKAKAGRIMLFISLFGVLLGVFFTMTRGPWVAMAAAIILIGVLRPNYRKIIFAFAILGVVSGLLGVIQTANTDFLQERMNSDGTVDNRVGFLANASRMIKDHPLFGIGYFNYMDYVGLYNKTTYIPYYGLVKKNMSANVPVHDIFLGRMAEEGMFGMALVFGFYFTIFKSWLSLWRRKLSGKWLNHDLLGLFAGMMVCYLIGGMIIDYRYFDLVNVIFYFLAGIIYRFAGDPEELDTHHIRS